MGCREKNVIGSGDHAMKVSWSWKYLLLKAESAVLVRLWSFECDLLGEGSQLRRLLEWRKGQGGGKEGEGSKGIVIVSETTECPDYW